MITSMQLYPQAGKLTVKVHIDILSDAPLDGVRPSGDLSPIKLLKSYFTFRKGCVGREFEEEKNIL